MWHHIHWSVVNQLFIGACLHLQDLRLPTDLNRYHHHYDNIISYILLFCLVFLGLQKSQNQDWGCLPLKALLNHLSRMEWEIETGGPLYMEDWLHVLLNLVWLISIPILYAVIFAHSSATMTSSSGSLY
jgi:hypothetical protein